MSLNSSKSFQSFDLTLWISLQKRGMCPHFDKRKAPAFCAEREGLRLIFTISLFLFCCFGLCFGKIAGLNDVH